MLGKCREGSQAVSKNSGISTFMYNAQNDNDDSLF